MTDDLAPRLPAMRAVADERDRQEHLKATGRFTHTCADDGISDLERFAILAEEVGEVARALNELSPLTDVRRELIQVAAVAVAWVEHIDAGGR